MSQLVKVAKSRGIKIGRALLDAISLQRGFLEELKHCRIEWGTAGVVIERDTSDLVTMQLKCNSQSRGYSSEQVQLPRSAPSSHRVPHRNLITWRCSRPARRFNTT